MGSKKTTKWNRNLNTKVKDQEDNVLPIHKRGHEPSSVLPVSKRSYELSKNGYV